MSIVVVDARLFIINGRRLDRLLRDDVPLVAKAITCAIRGQARVATDYINQVAVVHLTGRGFDVYIRGEDWAKITPKLADGTLDPLAVSVGTSSVQNVYDDSQIDIVYASLYRRVHDLLLTLFTEPYPTSDP